MIDPARVTSASASASPVVAVRVLGPVSLVRDGGGDDAGVVELPSATQRRLLALLAMQQGLPVRAEILTDALDLSPGALRKVVSRLRSAVGEPALRTTHLGYVLDLPVDASAFAAEVLAPAGPDRDVVLTRALARWHGDALEEFAGEPWVLGEAARLAALRAKAVEELAGLLVDSARPEEAIALLEPHLARLPVADGPRALMMRALAATGRQAEALRVFQVYRRELSEAAGLDPGPELVEVDRRIAIGWDGTSPAAGPSGRSGGTRRQHRLDRLDRLDRMPAPATRWIGPTSTVERVGAALGEHRVVTLTGPGGVGKTRTALEVARRHRDDFPDGVAVVELAALDAADGDSQVADAVATALGAARSDGMSITESILDRIAGSRMLLVLDNCEHVIDGAARLASDVAARAVGVVVLASSREPLRVAGERVVAVPPMSTADGVTLFCERAAAADDTVHFDDDDLAAVAEICARLDGLPLALELAAARTRSLTPTDLLGRLGRRFDALGTVRDGGSHHRTLFATIDWSYRLLDDVEQRVFATLSVFHGSFDLEAVSAVCEPIATAAAFDPAIVLAALVDKSMVVATRDGAVLRYQLLDTLREFAAARLNERGDSAAVEGRHRHHYVALARRAGRDWFGPEQLAADERFDLAWDNVRAAHSSALASGRLDVASELVLASLPHAQFRMRSEHGTWCAGAVAADPAAASTELLGWSAWWAMIAGDHEQAIEWTRLGLSRAAATSSGAGGVDEIADVGGVSVCHSIAAFAWWSVGRREEAAAHAGVLAALVDRLAPWHEYTARRALFSFSAKEQFEERADELAAMVERIGAPSLVASARFYQGSAKMSAAGDARAATELHRDGIVLARSVGSELAECQNLQGLVDARVALVREGAVPVEEVAAECAATLRRLHDLRYWLYLWRVLDGAAWLLACSGVDEPAHRLLVSLDHHGPPWRTQPRATTRALLTRDGADEVGGAPDDRERVVALALAGLTELAGR
ncbi:MAG: hypothetical protein KDB40_17280 [Acidimicrobiales bacterium]|nr:hypothetical protein [Acidimicrobiales bacterium]MCB9394513.1 hypothetical protein [Acidimicrobiaceae bacterium]